MFQRTAVFRIAVADRLGALPLMKVSDRLTDTAELVLDFALGTAWRELAAKHGKPLCGPPPREAGFAVIGYGKLGGLELGYGSDLDLVFLHDSAGALQETDGERPLENERFFARLVQRLIHFLTIQTSTGRLYEVDTRLRPSGRAGLMVTSLESFRRYQETEAWVWEHQALLRSRALAGSRSVCREFERIRTQILTAHIARDKLKAEVAKMRGRMRAELSEAKGQGFDLKQDPGGIADIEFLVDYWVLASSDRHPELVEYPDNIRQLEALERVGLVPAERCAFLKEAYLALRRRVHELALDEAGRVVPAEEFAQLRARVTEIWDETFADAGA
jgi:glutamate-ammonia-ligase adenylyltransferase